MKARALCGMPSIAQGLLGILFGLSAVLICQAAVRHNTAEMSTQNFAFVSHPASLDSASVEPAIELLDARYDSDKSLPEHAEEVTQITLSVRLDPVAHTVQAKGVITWKNASTEPASELYMHLYLNAFKNDRTVFFRNWLGPGRGGKTPIDWGYIDIKTLRLRTPVDPSQRTPSGIELWNTADKTSPGDADDQTDIRVPLPEPCKPGETLALEVAFEAKLPSLVERTGYWNSFHMVAQWFPKIARRTRAGEWEHFAFHRLTEFSSDFGTYDITIDAPATFALGATGNRIDTKLEDGRRIEHYVAKDIHDFAWAAWNQFEEHTAHIENVDVRMLSPIGYQLATEREQTALQAALRCYGRRFGSYPYQMLTVIHPPAGAEEAGGMEYPMLITTGGPWFGGPSAPSTEMLTVHEFGHQYFYGMIATNEQKWPFLDEGINTYAELECLKELGSQGLAFHGLGLSLANAPLYRIGALEVGLDDAIAQSADTFPSALHYGHLVYSRTATLLRTLGGAYGHSVVDHALERYARAYRFKHPTPRHFLAAFEDMGGPDLRDNLRIGLFERGWLDYLIADIASVPETTPTGRFDRNTGGQPSIASGTRTGRFTSWALVVRRGTLSLPVDIDLFFTDGTRERQHWDGKGNWVRLSHIGPAALIRAVVDPEGALELDEHRENNALSTTAKRYAPRVLERGSYFFELLATALAP